MNYPLTADDGLDDLPRTLRREKEARERARRQEEQAVYPHHDARTSDLGTDFDIAPASVIVDDTRAPDLGAPLPAAVQRLEVPFFHLMAFFLKAVVAAIPALLLLGAVLWGIGHVLQTFFPWLVKMQIFIHFPS